MIRAPMMVSHILPPDARELLVQAAEAPRDVREAMVARATKTVKTKYPQFFQKEQ